MTFLEALSEAITDARDTIEHGLDADALETWNAQADALTDLEYNLIEFLKGKITTQEFKKLFKHNNG